MLMGCEKPVAACGAFSGVTCTSSVELPGIEPDGLPGLLPSELPAHSDSFRFVPVGYLRFSSQALTASRAGRPAARDSGSPFPSTRQRLTDRARLRALATTRRRAKVRRRLKRLLRLPIAVAGPRRRATVFPTPTRPGSYTMPRNFSSEAVSGASWEEATRNRSGRASLTIVRSAIRYWRASGPVV